MPSFAQITAIGYVGNDVLMRYLPDGKPVSTFSLGVTVGYGERRGTLWCEVVCWNGLAETVAEHMKKGSPVLVSGEPDTLEYMDREGNRAWRHNLRVHAHTVRFLGRREDSAPLADDDKEDVPYN